MDIKGSGFILPPGVRLLPENQLKQISKQLAEQAKAKKMTPEQIDAEIARATGVRPKPAQPKVPQRS